MDWCVLSLTRSRPCRPHKSIEAIWVFADAVGSNQRHTQSYRICPAALYGSRLFNYLMLMAAVFKPTHTSRCLKHTYSIMPNMVDSNNRTYVPIRSPRTQTLLEQYVTEGNNICAILPATSSHLFCSTNSTSTK